MSVVQRTHDLLAQKFSRIVRYRLFNLWHWMLGRLVGILFLWRTVQINLAVGQ